MRTTRLNSPNLFDTVRAEGSTARQNLRNVWFGKKKKITDIPTTDSFPVGRC